MFKKHVAGGAAFGLPLLFSGAAHATTVVCVKINNVWVCAGWLM